MVLISDLNKVLLVELFICMGALFNNFYILHKFYTPTFRGGIMHFLIRETLSFNLMYVAACYPVGTTISKTSSLFTALLSVISLRSWTHCMDKKVWILISWLLMQSADLDLHSFQQRVLSVLML